jgi:predicted glycosyltransferase
VRDRRARHIGLYVHDLGHGSRSRAAALLEHLEADVTLLTALRPDELRADLDAPIVPLTRSAPDSDEGMTAPRHCPVARTRARTVLSWLEQEEPDLLVVDGCPQLAGLAHLAGVPTVGVRLLGAVGPTWGGGHPLHSVAPFPRELELPSVPESVRASTTYVGGYSPLDGGALDGDRARATVGLSPDHAVVTVVTGDGLGTAAEQRLLRAAASTRRWRWLVVGEFTSTDGVVPDNLIPLGWRDDLSGPLAAADVVVTTGGHGVTADVASVRRPHLIVQDPAAPGELHAAVAQLVRSRIATVLPLWPAAEAWAELLGDVAALDTTPQRAFVDHGGARRAADALQTWARQASSATAMAA